MLRPHEVGVRIVLVLCIVGTACSANRPHGSQTSAAPTPPGPTFSVVKPPSLPALGEFSIRKAGYRLAAPIQRTVAVRFSGVVYIAGGLDAAGITVDGVFSMDPSTGHLTSLGSLPRGVHDAAGAAIDGKLYVFAGGAGTGTDDVQAFDPSTGRGSIVGHLPVALSDLAAATVGATTYLVGGYDGTAPRSEIYATTDGTTFRTVGRLPIGLRYPAVTAADGRLIIAGGQGPAGPTNGIFAFDPANGSVRAIGHLPSPVAHASAFALGNKVYVVGGRDANDHALTAVTAVDPITGRVIRQAPLGHPLADAATVVGPGKTLMIGGFGVATSSQVLEASLRVPSAKPQNVYAAIRSKVLDPAVASDPAYVYVPNGIPGTVEVIDPKTFRTIRTIHLGALSYPEHVSPSWDLRWLYVDTSSANELAVIDPRSGKLVRVIHNVEHPYNLYFTLDGSMAIDVAEYYDRLDFMDPHTWQLVKSVPLPCNGPDHLDFSANGRYLMIGCEFDGTVVKVDVVHERVIGTVDVGGLPVDVKLSPNGKVFYIANQGTGGVSIVDP
ncbi:MAG: hypothetical protein ACRDH7_13380, partial [Actinomycetota bacterium]